MQKLTTDVLPVINVYSLYRHGLLEYGKPGVVTLSRYDRPWVKFSVTYHDDSIRINGYEVKIAWRACLPGAHSPIFVCPSCNRYAINLYGFDWHLCRRCLNLAYPCQNERKTDRALRQAIAIRQKLGWKGGICHPPGGRPKRMRKSTYFQLVNDYLGYTDIALEGLRAMTSQNRKRLRHSDPVTGSEHNVDEINFFDHILAEDHDKIKDTF